MSIEHENRRCAWHGMIITASEVLMSMDQLESMIWGLHWEASRYLAGNLLITLMLVIKHAIIALTLQVPDSNSRFCSAVSLSFNLRLVVGVSLLPCFWAETEFSCNYTKQWWCYEVELPGAIWIPHHILLYESILRFLSKPNQFSRSCPH